jgi:hypothetical protein
MESTTLLPSTFKPHRFVFAPHIIDLLANFSKLHQYDDRKTYKDAWDNWITTDDIKPLILAEETRIRQIGFDGHIINKLFISSRYYYRNKEYSTTLFKPPSPRKKYTGLPKHILSSMDSHIRAQFPMKLGSICENTDENIDITAENIDIVSPAESFIQYSEQHFALISEYVKTITPEFAADAIETNIGDVVAKFKKTYKNRFYVIRTSLSK